MTTPTRDAREQLAPVTPQRVYPVVVRADDDADAGNSGRVVGWMVLFALPGAAAWCAILGALWALWQKLVTP